MIKVTFEYQGEERFFISEADTMSEDQARYHAHDLMKKMGYELEEKEVRIVEIKES